MMAIHVAGSMARLTFECAGFVMSCLVYSLYVQCKF